MPKSALALAVAIPLILAAAVAHADEEVRLEVVQDNSIVLHPDELRLNAGAQGELRIKGNQHLVALAFDVKPIRGRRVVAARLICRKGRESIEGVTIATISAPWDEMKSNALTSGMQPHQGWAWPGARFPAVTGSNACSLVCQAKSVIVDGSYVWEVAPDLVQACALGLASGLAIHEWNADYSRNPTILSRESPEPRRPYLLVTVGEGSKRPEPARILELADRGDPDSVRVRLRAPREGFAYEVEVNGRSLPRWNIPYVRPGEEQVIPIRDVGLDAGEPVRIEVVTLAADGRRSRAVGIRGRAPKPGRLPTPEPPFPGMSFTPQPGVTVLPQADRLDAAGTPVGELPKRHLVSNEVFDGHSVRLTAARGEVVGFTAWITGAEPVKVECALPELRTELTRAKFVRAKERLVPDPLLPLGTLALDPRRPQAVSVDVYVPFAEQRDEVRGALTISDGRKVPVVVEVRGFSLPRQATFLMEMNSYGLPDTVAEYAALQELANDHRVHLNLLHYSHRTAAAGARKCNLDMRMGNGRRMDEKRYNALGPRDREGFWDDFATAFGPFLTGKQFVAGHRGALPLPGFYLTFHESWPLNLMPYFNGDPDAYRAFLDHPEYAETFVAILRDFLGRAGREGWADAGFQVYLNNKHQPDRPQETSPWTLDEPTAYHDYRALAFYADLVRKARENSPPVALRYRIDISRPQFDRGELWGKADLWVVNRGSFREYPRLLADRREFSGEEMWVYGQSSDVGESSRELMAWAIEAYRGGATGLVPWQTVNRDGRALEVADPLGIFIFDQGESGEVVIRPTLRLKAFRRAQQDLEYLELLKARQGLTAGQLGAFIDHYLPPGETWGPEEYRRLREAAAELIVK